jgi:hypothetical protein
LDRVEVVANKPQCVSARGAVPKQDYNEPNGRAKSKFRLITDMSRPVGKAVNEFSKPPKFKFAKFDEAVRGSRRRCWYVKIDLKAAYRHIALHRATWGLYGFKWRKRYFLDKFLPFGVNAACWLFTLFTRVICWICKQKGVHCIIGYVDDFLIIADMLEEAEWAKKILLEILAELGFKTAPVKCEGPAQKVVYLGLVLDSLTCMVSLPLVRKQFVKKIVSELFVK